jgi:hypothetical protein
MNILLKPIALVVAFSGMTANTFAADPLLPSYKYYTEGEEVIRVLANLHPPFDNHGYTWEERRKEVVTMFRD